MSAEIHRTWFPVEQLANIVSLGFQQPSFLERRLGDGFAKSALIRNGI